MSEQFHLLDEPETRFQELPEDHEEKQHFRDTPDFSESEKVETTEFSDGDQNYSHSSYFKYLDGIDEEFVGNQPEYHFFQPAEDSISYSFDTGMNAEDKEQVINEPDLLNDLSAGQFEQPEEFQDQQFHKGIETNDIAQGGILEHLPSIDNQIDEHEGSLSNQSFLQDTNQKSDQVEYTNKGGPEPNFLEEASLSANAIFEKPHTNELDTYVNDLQKQKIEQSILDDNTKGNETPLDKLDFISDMSLAGFTHPDLYLDNERSNQLGSIDAENQLGRVNREASKRDNVEVQNGNWITSDVDDIESSNVIEQENFLSQLEQYIFENHNISDLQLNIRRKLNEVLTAEQNPLANNEHQLYIEGLQSSGEEIEIPQMLDDEEEEELQYYVSLASNPRIERSKRQEIIAFLLKLGIDRLKEYFNHIDLVASFIKQIEEITHKRGIVAISAKEMVILSNDLSLTDRELSSMLKSITSHLDNHSDLSTSLKGSKSQSMLRDPQIIRSNRELLSDTRYKFYLHKPTSISKQASEELFGPMNQYSNLWMHDYGLPIKPYNIDFMHPGTFQDMKISKSAIQNGKSGFIVSLKLDYKDFEGNHIPLIIEGEENYSFNKQAISDPMVMLKFRNNIALRQLIIEHKLLKRAISISILPPDLKQEVLLRLDNKTDTIKENIRAILHRLDAGLEISSEFLDQQGLGSDSAFNGKLIEFYGLLDSIDDVIRSGRENPLAYAVMTDDKGTDLIYNSPNKNGNYEASRYEIKSMIEVKDISKAFRDRGYPNLPEDRFKKIKNDVRSINKMLEYRQVRGEMGLDEVVGYYKGYAQSVDSRGKMIEELMRYPSSAYKIMHGMMINGDGGSIISIVPKKIKKQTVYLAERVDGRFINDLQEVSDKPINQTKLGISLSRLQEIYSAYKETEEPSVSGFKAYVKQHYAEYGQIIEDYGRIRKYLDDRRITSTLGFKPNYLNHDITRFDPEYRREGQSLSDILENKLREYHHQFTGCQQDVMRKYSMPGDLVPGETEVLTTAIDMEKIRLNNRISVPAGSRVEFEVTRHPRFSYHGVTKGLFNKYNKYAEEHGMEEIKQIHQIFDKFDSIDQMKKIINSWGKTRVNWKDMEDALKSIQSEAKAFTQMQQSEGIISINKNNVEALIEHACYKLKNADDTISIGVRVDGKPAAMKIDVREMTEAELVYSILGLFTNRSNKTIVYRRPAEEKYNKSETSASNEQQAEDIMVFRVSSSIYSQVGGAQQDRDVDSSFFITPIDTANSRNRQAISEYIIKHNDILERMERYMNLARDIPEFRDLREKYSDKKLRAALKAAIQHALEHKQELSGRFKDINKLYEYCKREFELENPNQTSQDLLFRLVGYVTTYGSAISLRKRGGQITVEYLQNLNDFMRYELLRRLDKKEDLPELFNSESVMSLNKLLVSMTMGRGEKGTVKLNSLYGDQIDHKIKTLRISRRALNDKDKNGNSPQTGRVFKPEIVLSEKGTKLIQYSLKDLFKRKGYDPNIDSLELYAIEDTIFNNFIEKLWSNPISKDKILSVLSDKFSILQNLKDINQLNNRDLIRKNIREFLSSTVYLFNGIENNKNEKGNLMNTLNNTQIKEILDLYYKFSKNRSKEIIEFLNEYHQS
ncbi:MAG: hypothetical protein INQ03_02605 [Candidatus Heimdallarchaeota archaeon]|nr:hypothetical protein [Candidatus Heimdallarchaeota archaeon]